jgi:hypothetical protein
VSELTTAGASVINDAGANTYSTCPSPPCTPTNPEPVGLAFDGTKLWIANQVGGNVVGLSVAVPLDPLVTVDVGCPGGACPTTLAFDGINVWVTSGLASYLAWFPASSTGGYSIVSGFTWMVGAALAFDGTSIWVAGQGGPGTGNVAEVNAASTQIVGVYKVTATLAQGIAFDGVNLWIATGMGTKTVTEL